MILEQFLYLNNHLKYLIKLIYKNYQNNQIFILSAIIKYPSNLCKISFILFISSLLYVSLYNNSVSYFLNTIKSSIAIFDSS